MFRLASQSAPYNTAFLGYPASAGESHWARGCAVMVKQSHCKLPTLDFDKLGRMCHSQKTAGVEGPDRLLAGGDGKT